MAKVRIIAVGKLKESYLVQAQAEYMKRLKPYLNLEIVEVNDLPCPDGASLAQEEQVRVQESNTIKSLIKPKEFMVVLDRQGKEYSTLELAAFFTERAMVSESVTFVIGGSLGLSDDLIRRAHLNLSFSRLTFPHQLFRVILLEQIYRCWKINRNEPYHK